MIGRQADGTRGGALSLLRDLENRYPGFRGQAFCGGMSDKSRAGRDRPWPGRVVALILVLPLTQDA